eukprot:SAG11_NODE_7365_length_1155_cov_2.128788_2_plen_138_part_00
MAVDAASAAPAAGCGLSREAVEVVMAAAEPYLDEMLRISGAEVHPAAALMGAQHAIGVHLRATFSEHVAGERLPDGCHRRRYGKPGDHKGSGSTIHAGQRRLPHEHDGRLCHHLTVLNVQLVLKQFRAVVRVNFWEA